MLAKKKAAKKAAIVASVSKAAATVHAGKFSKTVAYSGKRREASRADAIDDGTSGDRRTALIRSVGDHINTRLATIDGAEDVDGDLFDDKRKEMMEEARLAAGTQQRIVSGVMAQYVASCKESADATGHKKPCGAVAASSSAHWNGEGAGSALQLVRVGHNSNAVTAVATLGTELVLFGDKSGKVYMTDLSPNQSSHNAVAHVERLGKKVMLEPPMNGPVTCIAVSDTRGCRPNTRDLFEKSSVDTSCTSYVSAGAADGSISIWETATRKHKGLLFMHRKPVTGLAFRLGTSDLYSVSEDATLRVWSVPTMMCSDKLFGHEGRIYDINALKRETCATVGDDGTMRFWKVEAATQQSFSFLVQHRDEVVKGGSSSPSVDATDKNSTCPIQLECVAMLNDSIVLAGAVDGSIVVFDTNRRKPIVVVPHAHGYKSLADGTGLENTTLTPPSSRQYNTITSITTVPYADVAATASYDGVVRLWHVAGVGAGSVAAGRRTALPGAAASESRGPALRLLAEFPVMSLVTSLRFSLDGDALYVGCSKESRLGRWVVHRGSLNSVCVLPLTKRGEQALSKVGNVEHVPAQLYNFVDNEEEAEGDATAEPQLQTAAPSGSIDSDAELDEDHLSEGGTANGGDYGDMTAEEDGHPFFKIGADGQLAFNKPVHDDAEDDIMRRHMVGTKVGLLKKKKSMAPPVGGKKASKTNAVPAKRLKVAKGSDAKVRRKN